MDGDDDTDDNTDDDTGRFDLLRRRRFARPTNNVLTAIFYDTCATDSPREVAAALRILYHDRLSWLHQALLVGIDFAEFAEGSVAIEEALADEDDEDDEGFNDTNDYAGIAHWLKAVRAELTP